MPPREHEALAQAFDPADPRIHLLAPVPGRTGRAPAEATTKLFRPAADSYDEGVELLGCGHAAQKATGRMCPEVLDAVKVEASPEWPDVEFVRWLTGSATVFDLLCAAECEDVREAGGDPGLVEVCEGCFERFQDGFGEMTGWRGQPEILSRDEPFDATLRTSRVPDGVTAFAPRPGPGGASGWLLLSGDGALRRFDADTGASTRLAAASVADESGRDSSFCWLTDDLLAIGGLGDDDLSMLDGVRIFDVASGAETGSFAGPAGQFFAAGNRLCSADRGTLQIWDPQTGERVGTLPGFRPTCRHPVTGELAGLSEGVLTRWTPPS